VLSFFIPSDIYQAKKLLSSKYASKLESCQFLAERRNSSTRAAHEAEIDDIIGMYDLIDLKNGLDGVSFVASNLDNLPKFGPEEFNLATVVDRQVRADAAIKDISAAIDHLTSKQAGYVVSPAFDSSGQSVETAKQLIVDVQQKMDSFCESVNARLDHLSHVCKSSISTLQTRENASQPVMSVNGVDRKQNIVVFGVPEDRDPSIWCHEVEAILGYVHGQRVEIVDMFRLGRFHSGKNRPVLVKLRSTWDKRIILSNCRVLKNYSKRGIFIAGDEPVEVRRQQTMDRLKYRAVRANKIVDISDGVLLIDGVVAFSLKDGYPAVSND